VGLTLEDIGGWRGVLGRVSAGERLSSAEAAAALADVLEGNATPAQIAAFMFGLRCRGETVDDVLLRIRNER